MNEFPSDIEEHIGKALRKARANAGMSLQDVARKSGLTRAVIRAMETGRNHTKVANLALLADFYATTPDELMGFLSSRPADFRDRQVAALMNDVLELRAERDSLKLQLSGAHWCGERHWRRKAVVCQREPGHTKDHCNTDVRLSWSPEKL